MGRSIGFGCPEPRSALVVVEAHVVEKVAMKNCVLMVLTRPVAGREAEYNDWYTNTHLADVLKVPGFKSAQRFTLAKAGDADWDYLAIYEYKSEEPERTMEVLLRYAGTPDMVLSQAMDMGSYFATPWVAITEKKHA